jgi:CheY-like chemotaxis protein
MALFGFGKEKKDGHVADSVLAYLEEAQRAHAPFTLTGPRRNEGAAQLQGLDEAGGLLIFQLSSPLDADKGARIDLAFLQDGLRIGGTATVAEARPGQLVATLPEALELRERRRQPRIRLNPKEGATLTALTGLFDGVGITGIVENLSEGGARVRVEKALNIKGEKRLPLGTALVPPGQEFLLVKLNKAPKCPAVMELEGRAVFLESSAGGLVMGLAFNPPQPEVAAALKNLVASRATPIPAALPPKARRRQEPEADPAPAPNRAADPPSRPSPEPSRRPADSPPAAAPRPGSPAPALAAPRPGSPAPAAVPPKPARPIPAEADPKPAIPAPAEADPGAPAPPRPDPVAPVRNETLLRLRKRSRAVVALVPSPAFGDRLKDLLMGEGFGRTLVTTSLDELEDFLRLPNLAVLILDGSLSTLEALRLVSELQAVHATLPPIILAVEEASTGVVLAARRQGVAQVLVKPYDLDAAFSALLAQQMGL